MDAAGAMGRLKHSFDEDPRNPIDKHEGEVFLTDVENEHARGREGTELTAAGDEHRERRHHLVGCRRARGVAAGEVVVLAALWLVVQVMRMCSAPSGPRLVM